MEELKDGDAGAKGAEAAKDAKADDVDANAKQDAWVLQGVKQLQCMGATLDADSYTAVGWVVSASIYVVVVGGLVGLSICWSAVSRLRQAGSSQRLATGSRRAAASF